MAVGVIQPAQPCLHPRAPTRPRLQCGPFAVVRFFYVSAMISSQLLRRGGMCYFVVYLLLALGLFMGGLALPIQVYAQEDEADESAASIYARTFDVSVEVAQDRLQIQSEITELITKIEKNEPSYAGSWIQHEPDYALFVGFAASGADEKLQKYLTGIEWADLVKAQEVQYTIDELVDIQDKVNQQRRDVDIPFASGTNYQTNKITVYTPQPDELRFEFEKKEDIQSYLNDIEFILEKELPSPADLKYPCLLGGSRLSSCTSGFGDTSVTCLSTVQIRRSIGAAHRHGIIAVTLLGPKPRELISSLANSCPFVVRFRFCLCSSLKQHLTSNTTSFRCCLSRI